MTRSTPVDTLQGMDHLILAFSRATPYLELAFHDGTTPLDHLRSRVEALLADIHRPEEPAVTLVIPRDFDPPRVVPGQNVLILEDDNGAAAFRRVHEEIPPDREHVIWLDGDAPFVSLPLARFLRQLHRRSWCDYTFGDGFPGGYAVQILRRETLPVLATLADSRDLPWTRTVVFDALSVDINAFDVETEAAAEDYSLLRAELTVDSRANYLLCRRLAERGLVTTDVGGKSEATADPDPFTERYPDDRDPLLRTLLEEPLLRRTVPRYVQLQVTDRLSQVPVYSPFESGGTEIAPELLESIVREVHTETPEAILAVGYRGEPGLYRAFPAAVEVFRRYPEHPVYLETSGVGWTRENLEALERWRSPGAVIVELDAVREETYRKLRGTGMEEALAFVERMRRAHPGRVYVQAVRMNDNEWELQEFYKHWQSVDGVQPLIQKYNSFAGRLPDRRVADLTPLKRVPCRHLERDLVVLVDGTVPRCFQDLQSQTVRGILPEDSLEAIWKKGEDDFDAHVREEYPALCRSCDEYYTINA